MRHAGTPTLAGCEPSEMAGVRDPQPQGEHVSRTPADGDVATA